MKEDLLLKENDFSASSTEKQSKKYFATFPNGIKIEIKKEYADKILWLQKIIREQRANVKSYDKS